MSVVAWSDLEGDCDDESTVSGSFLVLIGGKSITKPRSLSTARDADFQALLASWRIPTGVAGRDKSSDLGGDRPSTALYACMSTGGGMWADHSADDSSNCGGKSSTCNTGSSTDTITGTKGEVECSGISGG